MSETNSHQDLSNMTLSAFLFIEEKELASLVCQAHEIVTLDEQARNLVLNQIQKQVLADTQKPLAKVTEKNSFNDWLNIPDNERYYLEPTAECDLNCVKQHNDMVKEASVKLSLNIVMSILSPSTKLKLLGPHSLSEGKLIGQGKDSAVYALKGDDEWVLKVLKFGGAEKAELLTHYVNQLAQEARLKIEPIISLGDGRLLQRFVEGTPIANQLWGNHLTNAQKIASDMTSISKERLGLVNGKEFIEEGRIKLSVDPSFANHLFQEHEGKLHYTGNIDPIYTLDDIAKGR